MKNIFISSTFRDMQAERDMVQERVLPALREEARKYGDNVGVIDLRWGVDTSTLETEEGAAKVLKVCLDEIDRSHPYMLIFIGERYGWIPEGKLIERAVHGREEKYVTDDYAKSVTALEIEYGALSEKYGELNHCVICFREPVEPLLDEQEKAVYVEQTEEGRAKLAALKERIKRDLGEDDRLITYSCAWDKSARQLVDFTSKGQPLENVLTNCFMEMFRDDWKEYESLSWQDKEQLAFRALMESKLRSFVGREALLEEYYQNAVNGTCPIILQGEVGSGKTAIMCKLVERLQKEGQNVFAFFAGAGSMSTNAESLVKQMVYYVENLLGVEKHFVEKDETERLTDELSYVNEKRTKYDDWMERLEEACLRLAEGEKVYFYIDALDQLFPDEHVRKLDFFVKGKKVQIIASCTDTFVLPMEVMGSREVKSIPALSETDAKTVAEGILASYSRNAYAAIEEEILKKKSIGNPLYISLMIQRLNMMDAEELRKAMTEEEIIALGTGIIREMPEELEKAIVAVIRDGIDKISEEEEVLFETLQYLAVSRNGLRMSELQEIFAMQGKVLPTLDFALLMKYLDNFFYVHEDDRIDFTHKVIRQGLLSVLETPEKQEEEIKEYLKTLRYKDGLYRRDGMYFARICKDDNFARELITQAYYEDEYPVSDDLINAINNELLEDGGELCRRLIETEKLSMECVYFLEEILEYSETAQNELHAMIEVRKAFIALHEKRCGELVDFELLVRYQKMGHALMGLGKTQDALMYYEKVLEYDKGRNQSSERDEWVRCLLISYINVGNALRELGKTQESLLCCEKALECAERAYEKSKSEQSLMDLSNAYRSNGHTLITLGHAKEALMYYEKALKCDEMLRKGYRKQRNLSNSYCCIGNALMDLDQAREALSYYEKSKKIDEALYMRYGKVKIWEGLIAVYNNIGHALRRLGQTSEALTYFEKVLEYDESLNKKFESVESLNVLLHSYERIRDILLDLDRQQEVLAYDEKILKCKEEIYKLPGNVINLEELFHSYQSIGIRFLTKRHEQEALLYHEKALKCAESLYEKSKSEKSRKELAVSYRSMATALQRFGHLKEATPYFEKAIRVEGKKDSGNLSNYRDMGIGFMESGQMGEALLCFEKMHNILEERYEKSQSDQDRVKMLKGYEDVAELLQRDGYVQEALKYYDKCLEYSSERYNKLGDKNDLYFLKNLYEKVSTMLRTAGRLQEALTYYENMLKCMEEQCKDARSEAVLIDLLVAYDKINDMFMDLELSSEALLYGEKILKYKRELYEKTGCEKNLRELYSGIKNYGNVMKGCGHLQMALQDYEKALKCTECLYELLGDEKSLRALLNNYIDVGIVLRDLGQKREALSYYKKLLECTERLHEKSGSEGSLRELSSSYSIMGHALKELGRAREALPYYENALKYKEELYEKSGSEESLRTLSISYNNMGHALKELGRAREALPYYEKALKCKEELHEKSGSEESLRDLSISYNNVGNILCDLDRYEEALEYFTKNMRGREELYRLSASDSNLSGLSVAYNNYGFVLCELEKSEEALEYLEKALQYTEELHRKNPTKNTKSTLEIRLRNLARALRETNQLQEALAYEEKALVFNRELYDDDSSDKNRERIMKSLYTYAETLLAIDKTKEAYEAYTEDLEHCKSVCEKNDSVPNIRAYVKVLKGLYLSHCKLGQVAEAEEYLLLAKEEAKKLYERSGVEKDKKLLDELLSF